MHRVYVMYHCQTNQNCQNKECWGIKITILSELFVNSIFYRHWWREAKTSTTTKSSNSTDDSPSWRFPDKDQSFLQLCESVNFHPQAFSARENHIRCWSLRRAVLSEQSTEISWDLPPALQMNNLMNKFSLTVTSFSVLAFQNDKCILLNPLAAWWPNIRSVKLGFPSA